MDRRCHETVRFWWNRFGPLFASEIRRERVEDEPERREPLLFRLR